MIYAEDKAKKLHGVNFVLKVKRISKALGINPSWLMWVMSRESGLNPQAQNSIAPYPVGLIQFVPETARNLGTSRAALLKMSAYQQLDFVYKYYLTNFKIFGQARSLAQLYLINFYPAALKHYHNDRYVFGSERGLNYAKIVAQSNWGFDVNKDGLISMGDFKKYIKNNAGSLNLSSSSIFDLPGGISLGVIGLGLMLYFYEP